VQGQELLDHMFAQLKIGFKTSEEQVYTPNAYIDLTIKPCNVCILKQMAAPDLSKRAIMQDCAGNGATLNLSVRNLNQTGYAQRRFGIVDTEGKAKNLSNALQLSQSIATISNEQSTEVAQKSNTSSSHGHSNSACSMG
jgi:hypothetical protein